MKIYYQNYSLLPDFTLFINKLCEFYLFLNYHKNIFLKLLLKSHFFVVEFFKFKKLLNFIFLTNKVFEIYYIRTKMYFYINCNFFQIMKITVSILSHFHEKPLIKHSSSSFKFKFSTIGKMLLKIELIILKINMFIFIKVHFFKFEKQRRFNVLLLS